MSMRCCEGLPLRERAHKGRPQHGAAPCAVVFIVEDRSCSCTHTVARKAFVSRHGNQPPLHEQPGCALALWLGRDEQSWTAAPSVDPRTTPTAKPFAPPLCSPLTPSPTPSWFVTHDQLTTLHLAHTETCRYSNLGQCRKHASAPPSAPHRHASRVRVCGVLGSWEQCECPMCAHNRTLAQRVLAGTHRVTHTGRSGAQRGLEAPLMPLRVFPHRLRATALRMALKRGTQRNTHARPRISSTHARPAGGQA